jgi:uncharacterized tellurite resistance protein B-like protein
MTGTFFENLHETLDDNPAIKKIAGNPVIAAELLLLFRMILADGVVDKSEMEMFRRICRLHFGIDDESFHDVVRYLNFFCMEKTDAEAIGIFQTLDDDRKKELVEHMVEIASADHNLHPSERDMLIRTLQKLGYESDAAWR